MILLLRSLLFQAAFYLWSAALAFLYLPAMLGSRRFMARLGAFWSAGTLLLARRCAGLTYEVRGRENLPPGPVILAMKHQSAWETFAVPVLFADPAMVIKRELGYVPFYGWYACKAGMIPIDRSGGATALKAMLEAAQAARAAGRPILIFPEGTRTRVGERHAYHPGVAALYRHLGLPLVPIAVNSGLFWPRRSFIKRPGRIIVEILPPIAPGADRRTVMPLLEARIEAATARLVAEAAAPPVDHSVESTPAIPLVKDGH